jgi:hypothetical protein
MEGEASDFEYWGPNEPMSYSPVTAANMAIDSASKVISRHGGADKVGPSIFLPMHYPYNPHGTKFNVATYAYDMSGVKDVTIHYRTTDKPDAEQTYGGTWDYQVEMQKQPFPAPNPKPAVWVEPKARADEYRGEVTLPHGGTNVQYYVEAVDAQGNSTRSPIRNVYVA